MSFDVDDFMMTICNVKKTPTLNSMSLNSLSWEIFSTVLWLDLEGEGRTESRKSKSW